MSPFVNALACLLALGCATFVWRRGSSLFVNAGLLIGFFALFCLFAYFGCDFTNADFKAAANLESYPCRMLALCLCVSTTSLLHYRRRYLVLAQLFWLCTELFSGLSLVAYGYGMVWTRVAALACMAFCSSFLSKISREMEFCLMVFWIAIWIFF